VFFLFCSSVLSAWGGFFTTNGVPDCHTISSSGVCGCGLYTGINAILYNITGFYWLTPGYYKPAPVGGSCSNNMSSCSPNTNGSTGCCIQLMMTTTNDHIVCSLPGNYIGRPLMNDTVAHTTPCTSIDVQSVGCVLNANCIGWVNPGSISQGFLQNNAVNGLCSAGKKRDESAIVTVPVFAFPLSPSQTVISGNVPASQMTDDYIHNGWPVSRNGIQGVSLVAGGSMNVISALSYSKMTCPNRSVIFQLDLQGLPTPRNIIPSFSVPCVGQQQIFCPTNCGSSFGNTAALVNVSINGVIQYAWVCPPCTSGNGTIATSFTSKRYILVEEEEVYDDEEDELN